jgi:poly(A) polymerase
MIRALIKKVIGRVARRPDAARGFVVRKAWPAADLGLTKTAISAAAQKTCEGLRGAGHQAYVVGGGVRDSLLGLKPKDFDVATDARPEAVQRLFRRARIIGRRFQIVHVVFGREIVETSTFRALQPDAQTDEHGRVLRDNVFGSQEDDALRRDFTVNALYYDPVDEVVVDFLGGVEDLRSRRLRMIGDPATRYREDPVRMLRTVRFAAKLGFEVDSATLAPIRSMASLLENVPGARLFDEILKLLQSGHALECVRRLRAEGLHHGVLPLLDAIIAQEGGERFVTLALEQTDHRVNGGKSVSPSFLFATLLWHQVQQRWIVEQALGEPPIPALHRAIDDVLDRQAEKLAIQRRYQADMREIWIMQPRLERRGRQAWRLIEHLRFRAGYDFLLLRCDAGELPAELGRWWSEFIDGDAATRDQLLEAVEGGSGQAARKRRRRRKPRADEGPGTSPTAGADYADRSRDNAGPSRDDDADRARDDDADRARDDDAGRVAR